MASKLITAQHTCQGLLKFILPNDTVTVDLEMMTLTEVHINKKDKNNVEKQFFPLSDKNTPPPELLKKGRETQRQRTKEFLGTLLNQDLEPNFWPKTPLPAPLFLS